MHFGQVVAQRNFSLASQCVFQGVGADIGVAVPVTTNPLAHAQKAVDRLIAQHVFQVGVKLGNFAQKCGLVVAERVFHFIGHSELAETQQPGLP